MSKRSSRFSALRIAVALATAGVLSGACSTGSEPQPANYIAADAHEAERTYRLGIGDKLKITVFGEENLSGQFEVNALGNVSVPLAGEIRAADRPISAFRDALAAKLSDGYLKNPRITVDVLNYRPIYVHGEVKSGGEFPFKSGLRLRDAVALAGGYTYRANQNFVVVYREGRGEFQIPTLGRFVILPGDNIRIPERFF